MRLFIFFILLFTTKKAFCSNQDSVVVIANIIVSGNKKTNTNIILRELLFKKKDTIDIKKLPEIVEQSKQQIFNTTLFTEVIIETPKGNNNEVSILIIVKERWYIFPLPYFKLVDRNFNDWWVNHNHSLERVNYGIRFFHNNLSGNNDKLTAEYITGYSKQIAVRYSMPYVNKKMTNGINIGYTFSNQKEVNYATSDSNKPLITTGVDRYLKKFNRIDFTFTNRPNLFLRHNFRVAYTWENVDTAVTNKNGNYYGNGQTSLNYVDVSYSLNYSKTNYNAYPTKGFTGSIGIGSKLFAGSNNNTLQIGAYAVFINSLSKKMFVRNRVAATIKFPSNTGFVNQSLFGYGIYQMRGLEYYVVDGTAGLLHKITLGYNLLDFNIKVPIKNKYIKQVPFKVYGKVYNDFGYSYKYDASSFLNNKLLHTYGLGLDIVTFYDIVIKLEYSFNQLGNNAFYLNSRE